MAALFGQTLPQLTEHLAGMGEKPYRARQLWDALYKTRVRSVDEVTTFSAELRAKLAGSDVVGLPEIVQSATSVDGTERYLMRMADGETVETVWMPDGDGVEATDEDSPAVAAADARVERTHNLRKAVDPRNQGALAAKGYSRATICVSSQVGCAVNCQFCLTAKLGIRRNLTAGEIAGQVAAVLSRHRIHIGKDRINLVFMGMGEPFLNYDAFMDAVRLLVEGMGLPESRMTVSTSGIEPAIRRFAQETVRPRLALSLNASNDTVREAVMPITKKWKIADLLAAVQTVPLGKRDWVTFEYVLLGGVNDQPEHARGGAGAAARHHQQGQPDRVESGAGDCVYAAVAGGCGAVPEGADCGWDPDVYPAAAGARHFCGVRAVEADGGECACAGAGNAARVTVVTGCAAYRTILLKPITVA